MHNFPKSGEVKRSRHSNDRYEHHRARKRERRSLLFVKYDEISVNHSESDDGQSESSDYDEHQNQSKQTKTSTATAN